MFAILDESCYVKRKFVHVSVFSYSDIQPLSYPTGWWFSNQLWADLYCYAKKMPFKIIFNYETKERNNTHKITSTIFTVILSVFSRIWNISAKLRKTARFSISIFETGDLQQIANYTIRCARNALFRSMILHVFPTNHCSAAKKWAQNKGNAGGLLRLTL